jgi:hypothetical protein
MSTCRSRARCCGHGLQNLTTCASLRVLVEVSRCSATLLSCCTLLLSARPHTSAQIAGVLCPCRPARQPAGKRSTGCRTGLPSGCRGHACEGTRARPRPGSPAVFSHCLAGLGLCDQCRLHKAAAFRIGRELSPPRHRAPLRRARRGTAWTQPMSTQSSCGESTRAARRCSWR